MSMWHLIWILNFVSLRPLKILWHSVQVFGFFQHRANSASRQKDVRHSGVNFSDDKWCQCTQPICPWIHHKWILKNDLSTQINQKLFLFYTNLSSNHSRLSFCKTFRATPSIHLNKVLISVTPTLFRNDWWASLVFLLILIRSLHHKANTGRAWTSNNSNEY